MLSDGCLSVCPSACNVGVLWPNGWMDQGATWYGGRSRPRPHCFRWGPSSSPRKGAQQPLTVWPTLLGHGRPPQQLLRSCNVLFLSDCFAECSRGECPPGSFQSRPCSNSTDRHCTGLSRLYTLNDAAEKKNSLQRTAKRTLKTFGISSVSRKAILERV